VFSLIRVYKLPNAFHVWQEQHFANLCTAATKGRPMFVFTKQQDDHASLAMTHAQTVADLLLDELNISDNQAILLAQTGVCLAAAQAKLIRLQKERAALQGQPFCNASCINTEIKRLREEIKQIEQILAKWNATQRQ